MQTQKSSLTDKGTRIRTEFPSKYDAFCERVTVTVFPTQFLGSSKCSIKRIEEILFNKVCLLYFTIHTINVR